MSLCAIKSPLECNKFVFAVYNPCKCNGSSAVNRSSWINMNRHPLHGNHPTVPSVLLVAGFCGLIGGNLIVYNAINATRLVCMGNNLLDVKWKSTDFTENYFIIQSSRSVKSLRFSEQLRKNDSSENLITIVCAILFRCQVNVDNNS